MIHFSDNTIASDNQCFCELFVTMKQVIRSDVRSAPRPGDSWQWWIRRTTCHLNSGHRTHDKSAPRHDLALSDESTWGWSGWRSSFWSCKESSTYVRAAPLKLRLQCVCCDRLRDRDRHWKCQSHLQQFYMMLFWTTCPRHTPQSKSTSKLRSKLQTTQRERTLQEYSTLNLGLAQETSAVPLPRRLSMWNWLWDLGTTWANMAVWDWTS